VATDDDKPRSGSGFSAHTTPGPATAARTAPAGHH
jgi:hypothetical protein